MTVMNNLRVSCASYSVFAKWLLLVAMVAFPCDVARAQWAANGNDIYNTNGGRVGIGTASPATKLDVFGGSIVNTNDNANSAVFTLTYGNTTYNAFRGLRARGTLASPGPVQSGDIIAWFDGYGNNGTPSPTQAAGMQVLATSSWNSSVNGALAFFTTGSSTPAERLRIDSNGNVGIGTTTPSVRFSLGTSIEARKLALYDNANDWYGLGLQPGQIRFQVGNTGARFSFFGGDSNEVMTIQGGGNVGIGATSPSSRLHVAGDVTVDGNISAKYQDLAEWVPAGEPIAPGTVVIIDSDGTNTVLPSRHSYDTRVAGVVSATPGITLGEQAEGKVKVATTGRVRVRVNASQQPIRAGDLLVTSDKEGVAMKSEPLEIGGRRFHQPGTLIGKALEALNEGQGEILVLLSLQ